MVTYRAALDLRVLNKGMLELNGTWNREMGTQPLPNRTIQAARRYFRIGTTEVVIRLLLYMYICTYVFVPVIHNYELLIRLV